MVSEIIKVKISVNSLRLITLDCNFDYFGYHKNLNLIIVLSYIVLKKGMTNTSLHGTEFEMALGNDALCAQPTD